MLSDSPAVRSNDVLPEVPKQAGWTRTNRVKPSSHGVGARVGRVVTGSIVGEVVGPEVGDVVGWNDGADTTGSLVGDSVGVGVGPEVGLVVGRKVGTEETGSCVGESVGAGVGGMAHKVTVPHGATPFHRSVTDPVASLSNERTTRIEPTVICSDSSR